MFSEKPAPSDVGFTVIVPCYNEYESISNVIESLIISLKDAGTYEVIIVNDGSTDGSADILTEVVQRHPQVKVVTHAVNRGYGAALKTGIRHASAELLVITDGDGTYPNDRIPELLELAQTADADMVVGARTAADVTYPFIRKIPKFFLIRYASWIARQNIPDINSGLRVMRRTVVEKYLPILPDGFSFTTTITLAMVTNNYHVRYLPIGYASRVGRSKIRPIRDTLHFMQLILRTGMYFAPMRIFFPAALALGLLAMANLAYDLVILRDLTDTTVLLLLFTINIGMFGLLADMIDKRSLK